MHCPGRLCNEYGIEDTWKELIDYGAFLDKVGTAGLRNAGPLAARRGGGGDGGLELNRGDIDPGTLLRALILSSGGDQAP